MVRILSEIFIRKTEGFETEIVKRVYDPFGVLDAPVNQNIYS